MKKVLSRCLVLALVLCLVCSSCLAETGYETVKAYLNAFDDGSGISVDASDVAENPLVLLMFYIDNKQVLLGGKNAAGKPELTMWFPSDNIFLAMVLNCLENYDELSSKADSGYCLAIAISANDNDGEDTAYYITSSSEAQAFYQALTKAFSD